LSDEISNEELMELINKGRCVEEVVQSQAWKYVDEAFKRKKKAFLFKLLEVDPGDVKEICKLQVKALLYGEITSCMASIIRNGEFAKDELLERGGILPTVPTPAE
jgi:hypothetical protein